jgi:hypothetical protein
MDGGAGADRFDYNVPGEGGDAIIGFETGAGGDVIDVADLLASVGYAGGGNAFADGYLALGAAGGDTQVLFDADGGGDGFVVLATLVGIGAGTVSTSDNFAY